MNRTKNLHRFPTRFDRSWAEPVGLPRAFQVAVRLQPHDHFRLTGTDHNHRLLADLLNIGDPSLDRHCSGVVVQYAPDAQLPP
jgi:hypothetical protein